MRTKSKIQTGEIDAGSGEHSCETRRVILEAARHRFLHYGYKKTTIDEIAADAGVGKGTVYLHFDNKEDVLLSLVRQVKRNITAQMRCIAEGMASPEEKLRRMAMAAILAVHDARSTAAHGVELVDELLQPKLMECGQEEREKQYALLSGVIEEGIRRGEFTVPNGDTHQAARHLMLSMVSFFPPNITPCHAEVGCRMSLETRVNAMLDFVFQGLRSR